MKATLAFDLPEDAEAFRLASQASELHAALWAFDQYLRGQVKYVEPEGRDDAYAVRERLHEELSGRGIALD